ncbi:MAG: hypothetical protein SH850_18655 [Planctomycetaceae bacterium]|nr:hypothetical protein [Planctomycetaceae bacterium]
MRGGTPDEIRIPRAAENVEQERLILIGVVGLKILSQDCERLLAIESPSDDPYGAKARTTTQSGDAMPLTKLQLSALRFYSAHRDRAPTLLGMAQRMAVNYCLRVVIAAVAAVACEMMGVPMIGFLVVGMLIGGTLRDVGISIRTTQIWPVLLAVLDWNRIDQLLTEAEQH